MLSLELSSPCKVNLLLNILGKREDGFHELETVMQPVRLHDNLSFHRTGSDIQLTCSEATLPVDARNLVHRAARAFLDTAGLREGVKVHLEKRIPLAAGLGGGSGNAATTLLGLNELFGEPLRHEDLHRLGSSLGSDIPFFLQKRPALATGRGEIITPLEPFPALRGTALLLIHPGFGISTAWAYAQLRRFPEALNGRPGRGQELIDKLLGDDLAAVGAAFYNSLEAPALEKFPLLAIFQEFLRAHGAVAAMMSGSGSTTFAVIPTEAVARKLEAQMQTKFGPCWTAVVPV